MPQHCQQELLQIIDYLLTKTYSTGTSVFGYLAHTD